MMFIAETMIEVVVRPLMWKEDIAKTEVTLVITLAAAELRSSKMEEQRMNMLTMAAESTPDTMMKTDGTVTDDVDAAVPNDLCLNVILQNGSCIKLGVFVIVLLL